MSVYSVRGLCDLSGGGLPVGRVLGCGWGLRPGGRFLLRTDFVQRAPAEALEAFGLDEAVVFLRADLQKTRSAIHSTEQEADGVNAARRVKDKRLPHIYYYTGSAAVFH